MRLISVHQGQLVRIDASDWTDSSRPFSSGLNLMDKIAPPGGLARAAVHEVVFRHYTPPMFVSFWLVCASREFRMSKPEIRNPNAFASSSFELDSDFGFRHSDFSGAIVCSDPTRTLYPPALFAAGVNPRDLWILHARDQNEELWALAECLRCRGVAATVASLPARMHRNDVRRLQLAAERGGGIGIFMRPLGADIYAAATRWLVEPARGERTIQRWKLTLLHGHGG